MIVSRSLDVREPTGPPFRALIDPFGCGDTYNGQEAIGCGRAEGWEGGR